MIDDVVITRERWESMSGFVRSALLVPIHESEIIGKTVREIEQALPPEYKNFSQYLREEVESNNWN